MTQKIWDDKLKRPSVAPTIALRDAMEKIYNKEQMAARSLDGGSPVKSSPAGKIKKKKMTPKKREAVLGMSIFISLVRFWENVTSVKVFLSKLLVNIKYYVDKNKM